MNKSVCNLTLLVIALLLISCASAPPATTDTGPGAATPQSSEAASGKDQDQSSDTGRASGQPASSSEEEERGDTIRKGSGVFVQGTGTGAGIGYAEGDGVTLNFEQASLPEFLRVVFESILNENYLLDPSVNGSVTLHTTRPVTQDTVLPIVEAVLEQNGAALIRDEGMFKVLPLGDAASSSGAPAVGRYPSSKRKGYGIQVVPLQHVAASELEDILGPFVPEGSSLSIDTTRNVLILSGPKYRLDDLLATVRMFDVDWLAGMSFAMFRLEYADAVSVVNEIETIIDTGGETPLAGIVRVLPIERVNGVLVITHRPDHIDAIQNLIKEFDWGLEGAAGRRLFVIQNLIKEFDWGLEGAAGRRLFVYELENGKAENIASVLQQIFGQKELEETRSGELAVPGAASSVFRRAETVSRPPPQPGQSSANRVVRPTTTTVARPAASGEGDAGDAGDGISAESQDEITIIADQDNNAILVMATPQDYRAIEATIRRLDISPRQVLIEATIAASAGSSRTRTGHSASMRRFRRMLQAQGSRSHFLTPPAT
jgi:general secretion pathway protein D